jgi:hemerythrin-like domain-containing protein
METASQDLIHEHRAILGALSVLEKMYEAAKNDKELAREDIEKIIEFLKVFADKCHHGKEEDFLFPALEEVGVKNQNGPLGVMLAQHKQGREFIQRMQESIGSETIDKKAFIDSASSYVDLLRNHIEKEETILFPLGDAKFLKSKQQELLNDFDTLEKKVIGEGKHEEYHALLEKFKNKYASG